MQQLSTPALSLYFRLTLVSLLSPHPARACADSSLSVSSVVSVYDGNTQAVRWLVDGSPRPSPVQQSSVAWQHPRVCRTYITSVLVGGIPRWTMVGED